MLQILDMFYFVERFHMILKNLFGDWANSFKFINSKFFENGIAKNVREFWKNWNVMKKINEFV